MSTPPSPPSPDAADLAAVDGDGAERASLLARVLPWLCFVAYGLVAFFVWAEPEWRAGWDSALYVLTGRSLARGEGYTYLGEPFFLRPPGLAWILSLFMPGGRFDPALVNRVITVFGTTAVAAIYVLARRVVGRWEALAVALLAGTSPLFLRYLNFVLAELPFATCLFVGMACCLLWVERRRGVWLVLGALGILAAIYLRTVGVLALPGLVLLGQTSGTSGRRWLPALAALLVVAAALPWALHSRSLSADAPYPPEQLYLHDYMTAMFHVEPGDPSSPLVSWDGWLARMERNVTGLGRDLAASTFHSESVAAQLVLAALVLLGLVRSLRTRPSIIDAFALAYLPLILTYFTYADRLVMPMIPFVVLYLWHGLACIGRGVASVTGQPRAAVGIPATLVGGLLVANLVTVETSRRPVYETGPDVLEQRREQLDRIAAWIRDETPADAVVLANRAPVLSVMTDRRVYTYGFEHAPDPLTRWDIDYVVIDSKGKIPDALRREVETRAAEKWELAAGGGRRRVPIYRIGK